MINKGRSLRLGALAREKLINQRFPSDRGHSGAETGSVGFNRKLAKGAEYLTLYSYSRFSSRLGGPGVLTVDGGVRSLPGAVGGGDVGDRCVI